MPKEGHMWRFVLPALAVVAALLVLFAGAFGDLQSWPTLANGANTIVAMIMPARTSPPPLPSPPPVDAGQQAAYDALQHQLAALSQQANALQTTISQRNQELDKSTRELTQRTQELNDQSQQIAQQTQQLNALRSKADELRQNVTSLHQQQDAEQAALARQKTAAQQATAAVRAQQAALAREKASQRQMATVAPSHPAVAQSLPAPVPSTSGPPEMQPTSTPPTSQQLLTARQWLALGHPEEARQILAMLQTQMVFQPVTPGQPPATGGNISATEVGDAIRWLDRGADGQAMEALNRAINNTDSTADIHSGYYGNYNH
jgi:hypothetical protein